MTKAKLHSAKKLRYGKAYQDHLFEQYKNYISSSEKISERRQTANAFYLSVNVAILTALGLFLNDIKSNKVSLVVCLVGIFLCLLWWFGIRAYKQINTGKFKVIHEIEKDLPLSLYAYEWEVLGRGEDKKRYWPFSHIEMKAPWLFAILYLVVAARIIMTIW